MINLLDDTTNQLSNFRTRNWVKIIDESKRKYDNSNIKFKTSMIRSNLWDYSNVYILVTGIITVPNIAAASAAINNTNIKVMFKNCAPFTDCITEINNTKIDDAQDIDIVIPMYNVLEYSNVYLNISRSLWQYYRDKAALDANDNIIDFPADNNNSISFNFKQKIRRQTGNGSTKDVEKMVPLKYLSNFGIVLKMPLIKCVFSRRVL